jgi:hypothetical protein
LSRGTKQAAANEAGGREQSASPRNSAAGLSFEIAAAVCAAARFVRLLELVEKWMMEAEDPAMRERLVTQKLQRDRVGREIGELRNRMAPLAPRITSEKVHESAAYCGTNSTRDLRSFDKGTPGF